MQRIPFSSLLVISIACYSCIEAALPPLYQSMSEYKALFTNQQFIDKLDSSESIVDIRREQGGFVITTTKRVLKADIVYDPTDHPGPAKFHIEMQNSNLKKNNEK